MARFLPAICLLGQNPHVRCFEEHMRSVSAALRDLGHEVEYATLEAMRDRPGRLIIWGANALTQDPNAREGHLEVIPPGSIVFQSEQVSAVDTPSYFIRNWLKRRDFTVWDYASSNVDALKKIGVTNAVLCPVGYHPSMTMIDRAEEQDIDVLFYGSRGGPRREILNALDRSGMRVVQLINKYGAERDAYIARAKVVINMHYYPSGVFEIFRCSHLFANRVCVVNEAGGRDAELEDLARRCTAYTPREHLVERCRELVGSPHRRLAIAEQAFEEFKKVDLVDNLRRALEAS